MDLKAMSKTSEKITLREPITLDELNDLMVKNAAMFPLNFKLKKGLFGKSITFEVYMNVQTNVKVKDNIVTVRRMQSSTSVGVGGMSVDVKATQQRAAAVKEGGVGKAFTGGVESFLGIIEALKEMLKPRM